MAKWTVAVVAGVCAVGAPPALAFQGPWVAPPVDLSASGQDAGSPQLAVAADGTTTATWRRSNGTHFIVQASTRPPGGAFGAPVDLSASGQTAEAPQLAVVADGTTTATWTRSNSTHYIVQTSTRPPGGTFGAPVDLSASGQDAYDPQLAIAPDGTTTATWQRTNGTNYIVQASTRPPGGAFGAPVDLSATGQDAGFPQLAVAADGTTTVIWPRSNGTNYIVQASTRPPGGTFGAPIDLSATGQNAGPVQLALAADDTTTVVWLRSNGTNNIVQASTRPPGGAFGAPIDLSASGQDALNPQVAVAPDGTTTATWQRSNGTHGIVQASTRPPGSAFSGPVDLSASGQNAFSPQLAVAPDGTTTATWTRSNGTNSIAQAALTANPPAPRAIPVITGARALGATLTCDGGSWSGAATVLTSWLRGATQVATGPTYQVAAADQAAALVCRARATNPFGTAESTSLPASIPGPPAPEVDRTPPVLTVLTKTRLTRAQFRNGVSVRISANEPTTVVAELLARAKSARISAVPFNLALGTRTVRGVTNSVTIKIKPNRTLVGKARSLSVRLRLTATDAAGNRRVTGKTIRVGG